VVEVGDRFVLREAGRRQTVGGGTILDADPPARAGARPQERLAAREEASREALPALMVRERRAVRVADLPALSGETPSTVDGSERVGGWWVAGEALAELDATVRRLLDDYHRRHPMRPGLDPAELRRLLPGEVPSLASALERGLDGEVVALLHRRGTLVREGPNVRLAEHRVTLGDREDDAERLVAAVAAGEPSPPTIRDLEAAGHPRELVEACVRVGRLVRVSDDLVVTPGFAGTAEEVARREAARPEGLTVSRYRETLGTSRKYALPLLAWLDQRGVTRREGDLRRPGG
jgi:selenocysteine-specific elongation factor